ncbi:YjbH domain-containing protein [Photobacterium kagoshimensis]|uniref:YjbH domain-containing protein n=1 Tax=Photobacterium kagoshimensis TaxID=2910242 RepID=UPI003D0B6707
MKKTNTFALSALALALAPLSHVQADEFDSPAFTPSQSDFGGVGLMQMPTGRVAKEGEFTLGATYNDEYHHYTVSLQLLPWMETTIRYTLVQDLLYSGDEGFSGQTKYTDKGIDVKFRLLEESYWLPETSIGFRDIGGTGLFDGEFIAASKHVGPLDFTLGVGWGYIGNSANLSGDKAAGRDCGRDTSYKGKGGQVDYKRWFTGCAAVFGGVEYQTPWSPLRLKAEWDGNDYKSDFPVTRGRIDMPQDSQINYGALYRLGNWGDMRLSYERGNTWTFGVNLSTNFNDLTTTWHDEPKVAYTPTSQQANISTTDWQRVKEQLATNAGYDDAAIYVQEKDTLTGDKSSITVIGNQTKYRDRNEAHERAALVLADTGVEVDEYRLVETNNNQVTTETRIDAEQFAKVANHEYINAKVEDSSSTTTPMSVHGRQVADADNDFDWGIAPTLQQSFGSPEAFYLFNVGINANASYWLGNHIEASGSVYFNIYDNYDQFKYQGPPPDGTDLKRVRTLVRSYISDNPIRLDNLQLTWMDHFGDNFYSQAYGGYLEMMFGGIGGEVLYRPMNSNWAVGFDVNYVKQRDPNSQFGFFTDEVQTDPSTNRTYRVQTGTVTGHASVYYTPQWSLLPDTLLKVSAGQYLTEDKGMTVDFSKQFDSGVIAGAFASFTNLSAEEFGEGSFTKGFYVSIPFDLMTVKPSNNRATVSWVPLTRDGGQMLNRKYSLYDMTDARSPWYSRAAQ